MEANRENGTRISRRKKAIRETARPLVAVSAPATPPVLSNNLDCYHTPGGVKSAVNRLFRTWISMQICMEILPALGAFCGRSVAVLSYNHEVPGQSKNANTT
jgi:hypothetical protein